MKRGVEEGGACDCGELGGLRSSLLPNIDEMDMPPDGRDEYDARSRAPANGEAVGGPRGAPPGGSCGGDGGGIWRDWNGGGGRGDSCGPGLVSGRHARVDGAVRVAGRSGSRIPREYCEGLAAPRDCRRDASYGSDMLATPLCAWAEGWKASGGGGGGKGWWGGSSPGKIELAMH